jgi:hypothetical protein
MVVAPDFACEGASGRRAKRQVFTLRDQEDRVAAYTQGRPVPMLLSDPSSRPAWAFGGERTRLAEPDVQDR